MSWNASIPWQTTGLADTAIEVGDRSATAANNHGFIFRAIISKPSRDPFSKRIFPVSNPTLQTELVFDIPPFILEILTPDGEVPTLSTAIIGKVKKTTAVITHFVCDWNHVPFSQDGECLAVWPTEEGLYCGNLDNSFEQLGSLLQGPCIVIIEFTNDLLTKLFR